MRLDDAELEVLLSALAIAARHLDARAKKFGADGAQFSREAELMRVLRARVWDAQALRADDDVVMLQIACDCAQQTRSALGEAMLAWCAAEGVAATLIRG